VEEDFDQMGVQDYKELAREREKLRGLLIKMKTLRGYQELDEGKEEFR
jgi:hypothetical protein